ncbi:hypothetical protein HZC30_03390 [Candidatus Woesearchaeota archaeon]|nr:hypothetical protein [Candidatus Woesearchaeota archaeon]
MDKIETIQLTLMECVDKFMSAPSIGERVQVQAAYETQFRALGVEPGEFYDHLLKPQMVGQPLRDCIGSYLAAMQS